MSERGREGRSLIRPSDPRGPRPPFRVIASTIGLPLAAFLVFIVYHWLAPSGPPAPDTSATPATKVAPRAAAVTTPPASPATETPVRAAGRIALILDDVGYDPAAAEAASRLGSTITFAVIPGTPHAARSANFLAARGFEILCHLPMEPEGYPGVSPGEDAILRAMGDAEIRTRTRAMFRSIPHARGVNNHMGSAATSDRRVMQSVLGAVRDEGVFFIDSRTTSRSVSASIASELGVPLAARDVFLDDDASETAIREQLSRLAALAQRDGLAIGIGHLYPSTLRVLGEELPRLQKLGFQFVKASETVR